MCVEILLNIFEKIFNICRTQFLPQIEVHESSVCDRTLQEQAYGCHRCYIQKREQFNVITRINVIDDTQDFIITVHEVYICNN